MKWIIPAFVAGLIAGACLTELKADLPKYWKTNQAFNHIAQEHSLVP